MKLYRIQAVMLRHLLLTFRVFSNIINLIYWPFINIILWGFNSIWNESFQQQSTNVTLALLAALMLWQLLFRLNMEICYNLLDELQSYDFSSLFSTPLTLAEWMISVICLGLLKSIFTFIFAVLCILFLYGINVLTIGFALIPFIALIILTGWSVGFLSAAGIVYWGKSVHELVWVCVWAFVPFSGIFYSINVLPKWAQYIAYCIPQSYLFESLRTYIIDGVWDVRSLATCIELAVFYLLITLVLFKVVFEKSRRNGLSRLEYS
jgi:ABC-2 type transport system permease protein